MISYICIKIDRQIATITQITTVKQRNASKSICVDR